MIGVLSHRNQQPCLCASTLRYTDEVRENESLSQRIIEAIDTEIAKLQRIRSLLADRTTITGATASLPGRRRGRPVLSEKAPPTAEFAKATRVISAEGRAKIAAAQRKRWASTKRAIKKAATESTITVHTLRKKCASHRW